jgi:two-component system NtrC family sensor kinase
MGEPHADAPPADAAGTHLVHLAARLTDARTPDAVCERLVEHLMLLAPGAAARAYVFGPGDRCVTCPRAKECSTRDRCLHLVAGSGAFAQPPGHVERVPRVGTPWASALGEPQPVVREGLPPELAAPAGGDVSSSVLWVPLRATREAIGIVGVRLPAEVAPGLEEAALEAGLLAGAALSAATSRAEERRRFEQLLLVSDLGRKVNSILNLDLLIRQAVVDIQRTFGFRHVTLFMVDRRTKRVELRAQSSRYPRPEVLQSSIDLGEGVVGRVARSGRTVRVDDVSREDDYVDWWPDTKSELAVPVRIGGVVEAVLNVESDVIGAFSDADVVVLETAGNQLAIAVENARLFGRVKESEEEYRTLVESSPIAVVQLDTAGRVTYVNPAVTEITGWDKTTILSRYASVVDLAVPEDRPKLAAALDGAAKGQAQRGVEFRAAHADGRARWASAEIQSLVSEGGGKKGLLILARNISREKELQSQLHQSEKLKAMGEMVSGVAHELNNPLSGILGYAQLLLSRPAEQWSRRDLEKIEGNARRCKKIVENLLTFARQSRSEKSSAVVNQVIESVISLNEYQFRMDNVEMVRDFDPRVPPVPLDVSRWQQVFINLATNARDAMVDAGSPVKRITFTTRLRGSELVIRVEDTGPGIARHLLGRVFEPFFTTREHGTGLGLGLCYGIVTDHGGTITADSEPGRGAVFTIRLPCAPVEERPPTPEAEPHERVPGAKPQRALVVDDEQVVRDVVTHVLELHGYEVDCAGDSTEALARVEAGEYDVVLTDLRMPGELDGIGFHKRLQQSRPELARRVVFMTGDIMEHGTFRDIEQMGLTYVKKPFDIRELARVVNGIARNAEAARQ